MKSYIYYPTFEIRNQNWLKFALLYLEKIRPIIPPSGDFYVSDQSIELEKELKFIEPYRPTYQDGTRASLNAIDQIEKIMKYPESFSSYLKHENFVDRWRNKNEQSFHLFRAKYSEAWVGFCKDNGFSIESPNGLRMNKEIGQIYMSFLAQSIADTKSLLPITDDLSLSNLSTLIHETKEKTKNTYNIANTQIELALPANLNEIDLDQIIKFRKRKQFMARLRAFHDVLDEHINNIENETVNNDIKKDLGIAWSDFSNELLLIGTGLAPFSLGAWLFFASADINIAGISKEVLGGINIILGAIQTVNCTWKKTRTKRLARRYLSDLSNLNTV